MLTIPNLILGALLGLTWATLYMIHGHFLKKSISTSREIATLKMRVDSQRDELVRLTRIVDVLSVSAETTKAAEIRNRTRTMWGD